MAFLREKLDPAVGEEDYIIPSVLNRKVPEQVSNHVKEAALETGVGRLEREYGFPSHRMWGKQN